MKNHELEDNLRLKGQAVADLHESLAIKQAKRSGLEYRVRVKRAEINVVVTDTASQRGQKLTVADVEARVTQAPEVVKLDQEIQEITGTIEREQGSLSGHLAMQRALEQIVALRVGTGYREVPEYQRDPGLAPKDPKAKK